MYTVYLVKDQKVYCITIDNRGGMDWKHPYATKKNARHSHVIKYGEC